MQTLGRFLPNKMQFYLLDVQKTSAVAYARQAKKESCPCG